MMGLFDALANLVSATVKVAVTPIAIVKDVVDVAVGNEPDTTKKLIKSAGEDFENTMDELCGE